jgi:hypothetical protein
VELRRPNGGPGPLRASSCVSNLTECNLKKSTEYNFGSNSVELSRTTDNWFTVGVGKVSTDRQYKKFSRTDYEFFGL